MTLSSPLSPTQPMRASSGRNPVQPSQVTIRDDFWSPRIQQVAEVTLPAQLEQMQRIGLLRALTLDWKPGDDYTPHIFWESDIAKWLEAASYILASSPDVELEGQVDHVIELLAGAQQPDGYLNAYFTVVAPERRFTDHQDAHELYCAGHLIEAGVAHYQATGKTTLLEVVRRYADLILSRFEPGGPDEGGYDGHPEIELALMRLYRATGEERYLSGAKLLIDNRGQQPFFFVRETERRGDDGFFAAGFPGRTADPMRHASYQLSHEPLREQREAVGHSVRATYLYSGMTDVAVETGDDELWLALNSLWHSVTQEKMYVTGAIGDIPSIEGFGAPFHLPNRTGYGETCASIGLALWAIRLGNATGQASYFDVVERAMYNGILSGGAADGRHFFYGNPLSSDGSVTRSPWFSCACCPPNLARFIGSLGAHTYSVDQDVLAVNLHVGSQLEVEVAGSTVHLEQVTRYPVAGQTTLRVRPEADEATFTLAIRVPSWASELRVSIDGHDQPLEVREGYIVLPRTWSALTEVQLNFSLPVMTVHADPRVQENQGRVALQRGPVVYCLEEVDIDRATSSVAARAHATPQVVHLEGEPLPRLQVAGVALAEAAQLYETSPAPTQDLTLSLVPYYSWGNRGQGSMDVWLPATS